MGNGESGIRPRRGHTDSTGARESRSTSRTHVGFGEGAEQGDRVLGSQGRSARQSVGNAYSKVHPLTLTVTVDGLCGWIHQLTLTVHGDTSGGTTSHEPLNH